MGGDGGRQPSQCRLDFPAVRQGVSVQMLALRTSADISEFVRRGGPGPGPLHSGRFRRPAFDFRILWADQALGCHQRRCEMMSAAAFLVLSGWLYLICGRGAFWLSRVGDSAEAAEPPQWPRVAAVVPARDEAECIKESVGSLLTQKYPGTFTVSLVDDDSSDATA